MSDQVKVVNANAASVIKIGNGYMLKKGDTVVAFYADQIGSARRAYPFASSNSAYVDGVNLKVPTVMLECDDDTDTIQEISFPEFQGWSVHCVGGGKTISVCLTKD